jgi:hypothetical protein
MTRNPDATVYVYRHRETGAITALYSDAALDMLHNADYEHIATLEPRMWIEHHFDDATKEREACAKLCNAMKEFYVVKKDAALFDGSTRAVDILHGQSMTCEYLAEAILAQGA